MTRAMTQDSVDQSLVQRAQAIVNSMRQADVVRFRLASTRYALAASIADVERAAERWILRRITDKNLILAARRLPLLGGGVPRSQRMTRGGRIDDQLYGLLLPRVEPYLFECDEALRRLGECGRQPHIDLRDLGAICLPCVLDDDLHGDGLGAVRRLRRYLQIR